MKVLLFILLLLFSIYSSFLITQVSIKRNNEKHFSILANQFNKRHLAIPGIDVPSIDIADYNATYYLFYGPIPSIVLMPFVYFWGKDFPQVYLGIFSMVLSFIAIWLLSRRFKFDPIDSLWLGMFFVFSTVLFGVGIINLSAYQVQATGTPLILFALYAYFSKKSTLLIGLFIALAVMTRFTLFLALIFFFIEFLYKRLSIKQFAYILIPVIIAGIILGAYNYRRFHSVTETGYRYNNTLNSYPLSSNLKSGFISPEHIPANLYSFLLMPPEPLFKEGGGFVLKFPYLKANPWGMALWFTSPLFLLLLYRFKKGKYTLSAAITCIVFAIPSFLYYGIGFAQYGYRYALDFLPFLFLILLPTFNSKLSKRDLFLISVGVLFNSLFMASLWDSYPHFGIFR